MFRNGIQLYDCCMYEVCVNFGQTYIWNTVEPHYDTVPYDYKKHCTTTTKGESKLLSLKAPQISPMRNAVYYPWLQTFDR